MAQSPRPHRFAHTPHLDSTHLRAKHLNAPPLTPTRVSTPDAFRRRAPDQATAYPDPTPRRSLRRRVVTAALGTGFLLATATVAGATSAKAADSPSPPPGAATRVPSAGQLKAALLTAQDLGPSFTASTGSATTADHTTTVAGCPALNSLLNGSSGSGQVHQGAEFTGGQTGPYVAEALMSEPAAQLNSDYARDQAALASCKTLTLTSGGTELDFTLTPIDFGSGSTAMRMDGTIQGVQVNGYLAIDHVGPAELAYTYFQLQSGSSQAASQYFKQAVAKAEKTLGGSGG